jgi:hypothetical protein
MNISETLPLKACPSLSRMRSERSIGQSWYKVAGLQAKFGFKKKINSLSEGYIHFNELSNFLGAVQQDQLQSRGLCSWLSCDRNVGK